MQALISLRSRVFKTFTLAVLLYAALPAIAGRNEPTISDVKREIVDNYLRDRCGAAFGEARFAPLDLDDRKTWLRCLWLRDAQSRISRGMSADRTLTEWLTRNGITNSTSDASLAEAWRHPQYLEKKH